MKTMTNEQKYQYAAIHGFNTWPIVLVPLSSITDEDAIEVAKIYEPYVKLEFSRRSAYCVTVAATDDVDDFEFITIYFDGEVNVIGNNNTLKQLQAYDYLRSKGYAMPWMNFTVQDLIDNGVLKLKEQ